MQWAMEDSLYRIQHALRALLRNLPVRPLAWLLRWTIFPTGLPFHKPTDRLDHRVAALLQRPGDARDRLTAGVYTSLDPQRREGQLELALQAAAEAAPIEKTLRQARRAGQLAAGDEAGLIAEALALGILNETDRRTLEQAAERRARVIQVDAFDGLSEQETRKRRSGDKVSLLHRLGVA